MTTRLLHYRDGVFEAVYELGSGSCEVGRDQACDIAIDSPTMSRHHFSLTAEKDGGIKLKDLDAENGTYVNGVREYVRIITDKTTIQAGSEMFLVIPSGSEDDDSSHLEQPDEKSEERDDPDTTEPSTLPSTSSVAPVLLRRMQAEMRIRVGPHFVLRREGESEQAFAIGPGVTPIGLGTIKISLGPSTKAGPSVLAEVIAGSDGSYHVKAKALFSRIRVNGKDRAKARLKPGDEIVIGSELLVFHPGLDSRA